MRPILLCVLALGLFAQDQTELANALKSSRQRIDHIDDQIVKLLNERAAVVREVGIVKTFPRTGQRAWPRGAGAAARIGTSARAAHAWRGPKDLPNAPRGNVHDGR
jgi:hypothetical protein